MHVYICKADCFRSHFGSSFLPSFRRPDRPFRQRWRPVRQWYLRTHWGLSNATSGFTRVGPRRCSFSRSRTRGASSSAPLMARAMCGRKADGMAVGARMYARHRRQVAIVLVVSTLRQQATCSSPWKALDIWAWMLIGRMTT